MEKNAWEAKWWKFFQNHTKTSISFEYFEENLVFKGSQNMIFSLAKFFKSPLKDKADLVRIYSQIECHFSQPAPASNVFEILERVIKVLNKSFRSFFPESKKFFQSLLNEWRASCPKCKQIFQFDWPICGHSREFTQFWKSDAQKAGIIKVTDTLLKYLKEAQYPLVNCGKCGLVTFPAFLLTIFKEVRTKATIFSKTTAYSFGGDSSWQQRCLFIQVYLWTIQLSAQSCGGHP
jgi:hypothetical protein